MKNLRTLFIGSTLAIALVANTARAQEANPWKFEFHGFVTTSMFVADTQFGPGYGQMSLFTAPASVTAGGVLVEPSVDKAHFGGDIRQSRMNLSMAGPKAFGEWQPRGVLEFDLFGGFTAGAFGDESLAPRIRVAFAELKKGGTTIQIGQMNQLVVPQIPASVSHIAFPWSYAAGTIGWRTPGIMVFHVIPVGDMKLELAGAVQRGSWNDGTGVSLGEAAGIPQIEARVKLDGKAGNASYTAYLVGHYDEKDLSGWNAQAAPGADAKLTGTAIQVGGKFTLAPVTFSFNAYQGKAIGQLLGQVLQFGDISSVAGWAQLGFFASKELSVWAGFGMDKPDEDDINTKITAPVRRKQNQVVTGMVRYASGNYSFAAEYFRTTTKTATYASAAPTTAVDEKDLTGQQVVLSAMYTF